MIKEPGRYFGKYGEVIEMSGGKICVSLWATRIAWNLVREGYEPTKVYDDMVEFDGIDAAEKPRFLKLIKHYSRMPADYLFGRVLSEYTKAAFQKLVLAGRSRRGYVAPGQGLKTHCDSPMCFR